MRKLFKNFEVRCLPYLATVLSYTGILNFEWLFLNRSFLPSSLPPLPLFPLQIHNMMVQLLFSVTFALSCTMFELIIFEIVGILDSK